MARGSALGDGAVQRTIRVVAAVLERDGQYLITQRRATAVLPLMWEFPGGRVEAGETDQQALKRELLHRLGVDDRGRQADLVREPPLRALRRRSVPLRVHARAREARSKPLAVNAFKWVASGEFDQYPFTPADEAT